MCLKYFLASNIYGKSHQRLFLLKHEPKKCYVYCNGVVTVMCCYCNENKIVL